MTTYASCVSQFGVPNPSAAANLTGFIQCVADTQDAVRFDDVKMQILMLLVFLKQQNFVWL